MHKINVAILGCGNISSAHLQAVKANTDKVELYAVCDIIEEKAQACADKYGAKKVFTDYKEMLSDSNIHLVCLCTPSGMHAEMAVECAKAGKNVLCEKPLDVTSQKLDMMLDAFKETGMKLGSVFQYRTYPGVRKAKELLDSGSLGKILYANGYCKIYRGPEYYKSADWRGTWALDGGGCLMNQAIHTLDILCWLAGGVKSVKAETFTLSRDIEVEDTAFAFFNFASGSYGVFEATTLTSPATGVLVEIQCEKGRIEFTAPDIFLYKTDENGKDVKIPLDKSEIKKDNVASDPGALTLDGHSFLIADMADAIVSNRPPYLPGEIGRHAVDVILAIYESSREKTEVKISC